MGVYFRDDAAANTAAFGLTDRLRIWPAHSLSPPNGSSANKTTKFAPALSYAESRYGRQRVDDTSYADELLPDFISRHRPTDTDILQQTSQIMSTIAFPAKPTPRITSSQTPKNIGKLVTVIGEATSITPHANTLTLKMADDENIIVLLQRNSTTVEPNLLTEVSGKLVSRGQIESVWVKQYSPKETAKFNRSTFVEAMKFQEAYLDHYQV